MDAETFRRSLELDRPPAELAPALRVMWHDARGEWETAHEIAQDMDGPTGYLLHGYLHRVEGDLPNAGYWYRRAGRPVPDDSPEAESARILDELLATAREK